MAPLHKRRCQYTGHFLPVREGEIAPGRHRLRAGVAARVRPPMSSSPLTIDARPAWPRRQEWATAQAATHRKAAMATRSDFKFLHSNPNKLAKLRAQSGPLLGKCHQRARIRTPFENGFHRPRVRSAKSGTPTGAAGVGNVRCIVLRDAALNALPLASPRFSQAKETPRPIRAHAAKSVRRVMHRLYRATTGVQHVFQRRVPLQRGGC